MSHQLKEVLCARGVAAEWADNLPWVLLRLYAALKDESCVSTEVAALGQQLMKPGHGRLQFSTWKDYRPPTCHLQSFCATWQSYTEVVSSSSPLDSVDWGYIRKGCIWLPLTDSYKGPFPLR